VDFLESLKIVARQWRLVVPCLLLTVTSTIFVGSRVEPTYHTAGTMLLFFPKLLEDPETGETNSYISFGNLTVMANVLIDVLNQEAPRQRIAEGGAGATYELGLDPTTPTPLITVTATGGEADVVPTVKAVMDAINEELGRRQEEAGAPPVTWITAQPVTVPEQAVPQYGSRVRAAGVVAAVLLAATVTLAFLADNLAQRRSKLKQARAVTRLDDLQPPAGPALEPSGWRGTRQPAIGEGVLSLPESTASSPEASGAAG
jgi:hypothetical protein